MKIALPPRDPDILEIWVTTKPINPKRRFKTYVEAHEWARKQSRKTGKTVYTYGIATTGSLLVTAQKGDGK